MYYLQLQESNIFQLIWEWRSGNWTPRAKTVYVTNDRSYYWYFEVSLFLRLRRLHHFMKFYFMKLGSISCAVLYISIISNYRLYGRCFSDFSKYFHIYSLPLQIILNARSWILLILRFVSLKWNIHIMDSNETVKWWKVPLIFLIYFHPYSW